MSRRLTYIVKPEEDGIRVDTVLRHALGLTGSVIRRVKWLEDGILLDGEKTFPNVLVRAGQTLDVAVDDPQRRSQILPSPGPLDILYEDDHLLVLNKQAGVLVHPIVPDQTDTLGNFLLWHYQTTGQTETLFHPVHRLDRGTTGLLVVAKHPSAQTALKNQLHTDDFRREYLAVTVGTPQPLEGVIDAPIAHAPDSPIAHRVDPDGLRAVTHYRTLRPGPLSLVELCLDTGRTHQIRVHLAHIGCPIFGDFLYGAEESERISRPALHSHKLSFRHPVSKEMLTFTQELPPDMEALLLS